MLDLSMLKEPVVTGLSSDASGKLTATFSDKSTKVISVLQPPPKSDTNTADWTLYPDVFCLGATVVREGDVLALERESLLSLQQVFHRQIPKCHRHQ